MKKYLVLFLMLFSLIGLASCNTEKPSDDNPNDNSGETDIDDAPIKTPVAFSITADEITGALSYDDATKTYTVLATGSYTLTGTLENGSILVSAEKVTLNLNGTTISNTTTVIKYSLDSSKLTINALANTKNKLSCVSEEEVSTIESNNNLVLQGFGELEVVNTGKHAIKASEITIKDITLTASSTTADCIHGKSITISSGTFKLTAKSDCIEAELNKKGVKGDVTIEAGTFEFLGGNTAIQVASALTVASTVVVNKVLTESKVVASTDTAVLTIGVDSLK